MTKVGMGMNHNWQQAVSETIKKYSACIVSSECSLRFCEARTIKRPNLVTVAGQPYITIHLMMEIMCNNKL